MVEASPCYTSHCSLIPFLALLEVCHGMHATLRRNPVSTQYLLVSPMQGPF